jgi:hypothetical protein
MSDLAVIWLSPCPGRPVCYWEPCLLLGSFWERHIIWTRLTSNQIYTWGKYALTSAGRFLVTSVITGGQAVARDRQGGRGLEGLRVRLYTDPRLPVPISAVYNFTTPHSVPAKPMLWSCFLSSTLIWTDFRRIIPLFSVILSLSRETRTLCPAAQRDMMKAQIIAAAGLLLTLRAHGQNVIFSGTGSVWSGSL